MTGLSSLEGSDCGESHHEENPPVWRTYGGTWLLLVVILGSNDNHRCSDLKNVCHFLSCDDHVALDDCASALCHDPSLCDDGLDVRGDCPQDAFRRESRHLAIAVFAGIPHDDVPSFHHHWNDPGDIFCVGPYRRLNGLSVEDSDYGFDLSLEYPSNLLRV